jgi:predicted acyltransferase
MGILLQNIGMNSIFVYLFTRMIDVKMVAEFFIGWLAKPLGDNANLLLIIGGLAVVWLLLYFMYKKKIFLRV